MFKLVVDAEIRPTEDTEHVLQAIRNVLPESKPTILSSDSVNIARAEVDSARYLSRLHSLLRRERILDAARRSLFAGVSNTRLEFSLHKQAAFAGRISFCTSHGESPLGSLHFSIQCSDPNSLIEWLAPKTIHGKPVKELPEPSFN